MFSVHLTEVAQVRETPVHEAHVDEALVGGRGPSRGRGVGLTLAVRAGITLDVVGQAGALRGGQEGGADQVAGTGAVLWYAVVCGECMGYGCSMGSRKSESALASASGNL